MTIPISYLIFYGSFVVLSSAANAMSTTDRSFYGWLMRFLRLLTNSAQPLLEKELHVTLPTPADAATQTPAQPGTLNVSSAESK